MSCWRNSQQYLQALSLSYKRHAEMLPSEYLRQFFGIKHKEDMRDINRVSNKEMMPLKKIRRLEKIVRRLEAANAGRPKAMDHVLDVAYGRRGKMRWELLQPMMPGVSSQPTPERIIAAVEKSRPPVYSPELVALLTSAHSRMIKPLSPHQLKSPPKLPMRAEPNSEGARLYGPFSKRREVNIRWRHFTSSHQKVLPPLHVICTGASRPGEMQRNVSGDSLRRLGVRSPETQNSGIFEEIEALARPCPCRSSDAKREPPPLLARRVSDAVSVANSHLPRRLLRRAYGRLLSRLPLMNYTVQTSPQPSRRTSGRLTVQISSQAIGNSHRKPTIEAEAVDIAWVGVVHHKA